MAKILGILMGLVMLASSAYADDAAQRKQELAQLKNQAQQKEQELKKYREQEKKISKEITDLQNKKAEAEKRKNKVEMDLSLLEQNLLSIEEKRTALSRSMPMWQGLAWQELVHYYLEPACVSCPEEHPIDTEIFIDRMLTHKAVFAQALQKENQDAQERLADFSQRNKQLQAESSQLKKEQAVISQSFQKKQQDLNVTKRKVDGVRKEINELNKSATELNKLLASFEQKRQKAAKGGTSSKKSTGPKINVPPHSLPWPVTGKVISQFGKEYRADLNTWIFRDGIKIAATHGSPVRASAAGSVIYAGPFRSYGNVVIIDHAKGFFTIYGFLNTIQVSVGDSVAQQGTVGTVGKDSQATSGTGQSAVYFEMRQGTTAVDPLDWLKK
ncbi:MAG: peptidoglycan DD-metalloendopeptidase family protein [Elusimicrobiaceae bacterium]|nr:peptidoglycan DD-metalloendopeptidase family protein [Elusimicrobiaceae bacterium]MBP5616515.1 peptidoglycan DD-metalloendopeptidase family protein [Elusimicrobiaceae bacterium]